MKAFCVVATTFASIKSKLFTSIPENTLNVSKNLLYFVRNVFNGSLTAPKYVKDYISGII